MEMAFQIYLAILKSRRKRPQPAILKFRPGSRDPGRKKNPQPAILNFRRGRRDPGRREKNLQS